MLQLNPQKLVKKSRMSELQSVSAVPNAEPQLDLFWTFFPIFFVSCLQGTSEKRMTTCKLFSLPQLKNLKFVMLWPQLLRSISNCVVSHFASISYNQAGSGGGYTRAGGALGGVGGERGWGCFSGGRQWF